MADQKKLVNPSDDFMRRMELAQTKMRQEMPNEMASASIQPVGIFSRMANKVLEKTIGGAPVATTGPFGGVRYNPELMQGMSQNDIEDTLAHELTHVRQFNQMPLLKKIYSMVTPQKDEGLPEETQKSYRMQGWEPSYRGKSTEMEAYQTETQRKINRGEGFPGYDINLPSIKTGPSSDKLKKLTGK